MADESTTEADSRLVGTAVGKDLDSGSQSEAIESASRLGCDASQIMLNPPRSYRRPAGVPDHRLRQTISETGMTVYQHASMYCVLSKDPDDPKQRLANRALRADMRECARLGMKGVVVHPGKCEPENWILNMEVILMGDEVWDSGVKLLIETGVHNKHVSPTFLADVCQGLGFQGREHVGVVIDTAHMYAGGLDITDPDVLEDQIAPAVDYIDLVHLNNPRHGLGSKRDGHGRLMDGCIEEDTFTDMVRQLDFLLPPRVPFIIEATDLPEEIQLIKDLCARSEVEA